MRTICGPGVPDSGILPGVVTGVDEAGCFRRPARWVDCAGPVTDDAVEGVALFDHPGNPGHPVAFPETQRYRVPAATRRQSLFGVTFVQGLHAPTACCWILRFQILSMQKA